MHCGVNPRPLGDVFELSLAEIAVERHSAFDAIVSKKNVRLAVAVIVEKARART